MMAPHRIAEFPESLEWINCEPLRLDQQRGRVVVLLFFSAGSVNCHNALDELQAIAARHADAVTVIAVHTPKFDAEREPRLALKAVNRQGFRQPVAHDRAFALWQRLEVQAWPTIVLLDPQGRVAERFIGDQQRDAVDRAINRLLESVDPGKRAFGTLPICVRPEPLLPLAFPCGLAVNEQHLYVADSAHHRILECTHEGRVLRTFGSGNAGLVDGRMTESSLNLPRGLCLAQSYLYVADTGNHALRRITLLNGEIETLAGNGRPGALVGAAMGKPADIPLDTPWALVASNDKLFIAMAGAHQIWEYDQTRRVMKVLAGTGRIGLVDGAGDRCALAQPSALALIQQTLYVADAASSAIRGVHVLGGQTHTLIGQGLFEFGDQDGARHTALLQHPLGLTLDPRTPQLWIADTYNGQLKTLRLGGGELRRFDIGFHLAEPAALAASQTALWVANTNAHEVLRVDLGSGKVARLPIGE